MDFCGVVQRLPKVEPASFDVTEKLFTFASCSKCMIPHQINFKRFRKDFKTLPEYDYPEDDYPNDTVDYVFDLHGQPVGLCLSPDHKYLYVNCRPFEKDYVIKQFDEKPPLLNIIEINIIDLHKMVKLDTILKSNVITLPFYLYMDTSDDYVASGSEEFGYIWDRHYRICFNKYPHANAVNSMGFNPVDPEMLVTVSDDHHVKVWRSHNWFHQQHQEQERQQRRQNPKRKRPK